MRISRRWWIHGRVDHHRTGIKERRIAAEDEYTSDMATKAARNAIEQAGISPRKSISSSWRPSRRHEFSLHLLPGPAEHWREKGSLLRHQRGLLRFVYGLEIAQQFITNHTYNTVLVIGRIN